MGTTITLNEKFFERDAAAVAKDLLGGTILYRGKDGAHRYWITETEAYYHDEQEGEANLLRGRQIQIRGTIGCFCPTFLQTRNMVRIRRTVIAFR